MDQASKPCAAEGFTVDNFNSDIQAMIAGKMTTSDLARMRVTLSSACSIICPDDLVIRVKHLTIVCGLQAVSKAWKAVADILEVRASEKQPHFRSDS